MVCATCGIDKHKDVLFKNVTRRNAASELISRQFEDGGVELRCCGSGWWSLTTVFSHLDLGWAIA